jgi:predicted  nucleic acid-binding Zn-ribbon protein
MEEHMSDLELYIEKLEMKKAHIGGFDKESVYTSMRELASIYQKEIIHLKEEKVQMEKACRTAADDLERANAVIQQLRFQLEEEQKNQNTYNMRYNTLTQAIDAVNMSKDKIIEEAKKTAAEMIAEANEKITRINMEYILQKQRKDVLSSKIGDAKYRLDASIDGIRSTLMNMIIEVDELRNVGFERAFTINEIEIKNENSD